VIIGGQSELLEVFQQINLMNCTIYPLHEILYYIISLFSVPNRFNTNGLFFMGNRTRLDLEDIDDFLPVILWISIYQEPTELFENKTK
jgi:hypothetical protein